MAATLMEWAQGLQLVGLFLEVWGAVLLLGEYVGNDFDRVQEFKRTRALFDLVLEDSGARERSRFLGLPGVLLLIIGFLSQLTGLALQVTASAVWGLSVLVITLMLILYIINNLIRSGTNKTYREIFEIIFSNARGWLTQDSKKLRCNYCHRRMKEENIHVWWIPDVTDRITHLRSGHEKCLSADAEYEQSEDPNRLRDGLSKGVVRRMLSDVRLQGLDLPLDQHDRRSRDTIIRLGIPGDSDATPPVG